MKAIRWPGFIAFFFFLLILIGGSWLFAESIIKSIAESSLTKLNGASVDIQSVNLNYSPLGLHIYNIEITDADNPMTNMVQIAEASFVLSFSDLLFKKVIIEDMSLKGIEVDTARKKSGALKKQPTTETTKKQKEDSFIDMAMPDMELPDVNEIIQQEKLETENLISDLEQDLDKTQNSWNTIQNDINDKKRWDAYEARYKKIQADFKGDTRQKLDALKQAKALKDDLKKETAKIQQARKQFSEDNKRLGDKFTAVKNGPGNDVKRIREKYSIDKLDAQNISSMLFGPQAAEYTRLAEKWYKRLKPYIEDSPEEIAEKKAKERKQGLDVKFTEYNPRPDFFVRKASLDASLPRGNFTGMITDISSDQSINKKPMRMKLSGDNLHHRKSESFAAEFNYVNKDKGYSRFQYNIQAYQLTDFNISKSDKLPLNMKQGLMNFSLDSRLADKKLTGVSHINFSQVNFISNNSASSNFSRMLATSFSRINQFNIDARFSGSLHNLDFRLDSDLDNQVGAQIKNQFKQRAEEFETQLKSKIDQKLSGPMQKIDSQRRKLDQIKNDLDKKEQEISNKLKDIENRIKNSSKSGTDQKKEDLKNKLKSKFGL